MFILQVLLSVGALLGSLVGGWIVDYAGRKMSLILFGIPSSLGWLMIVLTLFTDGSPFRPLLYGGRLLIGFSIGYVSLCVPVRYVVVIVSIREWELREESYQF